MRVGSGYLWAEGQRFSELCGVLLLCPGAEIRSTILEGGRRAWPSPKGGRVWKLIPAEYAQ